MKSPVIVLYSNKNEAFGSEHFSSLKISFKKALPTFENSIMIDYNLKVNWIKRAYKVGWGNLFLGFSIYWKQRLIKIDFEVVETKTLSLLELKDLIINHIKKKPTSSMMKKIYGSMNNLELRIKSCSDKDELFKIFLFDN